jgi:hypothetical protein
MRLHTHRKTLLAAAAASLLCATSAAQAQAAAPTSITTDAGTIRPIPNDKFFKKPGYSPYAGRSFPVRPLWGAAHLVVG